MYFMPVMTTSEESNMWTIAWAFLQNASLRVWKWVGIVGGVLLACLYFFTSGKRAARRKISEDNADIVKRMLEETTHRPSDKDETVERARTGL